jgi:hypothetical protein
MTADLNWPARLLRPATVTASPLAQSSSGGVSITGGEQIIGNSPGRWKITLGDIPLKTNEQIRVWAALEAALQGRVRTIRVPVFDYGRAPWPGSGRAVNDVPQDDATIWNDGSGAYTPTILAYANGDIDVGAVTGSVRIEDGGTLLPGQHFSVEESVYRLTKIESASMGSAGEIYSVKFMLPARTRIPAGTQLDFSDPRARCRLATDDAMVLARSQWKFGTGNVTFLEDVPA